MQRTLFKASVGLLVAGLLVVLVFNQIKNPLFWLGMIMAGVGAVGLTVTSGAKR